MDTPSHPQTINPDRLDVIRRELAWHEENASKRRGLDILLYDAPAFDAVNTSTFAHLLDNRPKRILDMGCGEGKETLLLAEQGVTVVSTDLSWAQLKDARERLENRAAAQNVLFVVSNAEESPFVDGAFESIHAKAILHHLDMAITAREVTRLLKTNGRAAFAEPLTRHPMIALGRRLTPQFRTDDEQPMTLASLSAFGRQFSDATQHQAFLLAPLAYLVRALPFGERPFRWLHRLLMRADSVLFRLIPPLKQLAWYGWVNLTK